MNKCILLVRVSTEAQDLTQQTEKVKAEAIRDGYSENDIIVIEDKESAVKLSEEERHGLNELKRLILSDSDIRCVYTYEISRISRRAAVVYSIRDFLIKNNVDLVVLNPYFRMLNKDGTLSETSNIFFGIFASLSENEGTIRKARLRRGVEKAKKEGRHAGGRTVYGYTTDKNHRYIIDEEKATIVRRVFHEYNNGKSLRGVAKDLVDEGVVNTCFLTTFNNVNRYIHDIRYTGEGPYPVLISKLEFDNAQTKCKNANIEVKNVHNPALLKSLVHDRYTMLLLSANHSTKTYYSKRMKGCAVSFKALDGLVWPWCVELYKKYFANKDIQKKRINIQIDKIKNIMRKLDKDKKDTEERIDRLEERIIMGNISTKKGDELSEKLSNDLINIMLEFKRRYDEMTVLQRQKSVVDETDLPDFDAMDSDTRREIVVKTIREIIISRDDRCTINVDMTALTGETRHVLYDTFRYKILEESSELIK